MRLVFKPAGIVILLASFAALAFLAIRGGNNKDNNPPVAPTAPRVASDAAAYAVPTEPLPPVNWNKARRILEPDIASNQWKMLISPGGAAGTHKVVPASVKGHPFARRITIEKIGTNPWDIQIAHPLEVAFKKGSRLRLTYWGRSSTSNEIAAVVEEAKEPYTKVAYRKAQLTPEWKQYSEEWNQTANTASGWAHVDFQVASKVGDVEFTGIIIDAVEGATP